MPDSFEKRARERRKQQKRREKAERKRERGESGRSEPEVVGPEQWFDEPGAGTSEEGGKPEGEEPREGAR